MSREPNDSSNENENEAAPTRADVAAVIARGGPHAIFQPIVRLDSRRVIGFESLSRFGERATGSPDVWFEAAEEAGVRAELELGAVRSALSSLNHVPTGAYLSINVSPDVAMRRELHALVSLAPLDRIVIEITEQVRVPSYEKLEKAIADLRAQGMRVAVDDAGAGNAGIAHLVRLKPDIVKLDRSVVQGITYDDGRRALVSSLVSFAHATNASIVAEGIESEGEVAALLALGVVLGQGYLFARPGPLPATLPAGRPVPRERRRTPPAHRRARIAARLAAAALTLFLIVGPTAAFAQNAQPGNPLWRVKTAFEDLRLAMERDAGRRLNLHMEFASRRVAELASLLEFGSNPSAMAAARRNLEAHLLGSEESLAHVSPARARAERARFASAVGQHHSYLQAQVASACATPGSSRVHAAVCDQARKAAQTRAAPAGQQARPDPLAVKSTPVASVRPPTAAPAVVKQQTQPQPTSKIGKSRKP